MSQGPRACMPACATCCAVWWLRAARTASGDPTLRREHVPVAPTLLHPTAQVTPPGSPPLAISHLCSNFLPATGTLRHLSAPAQSPSVRVDTGVRQGDAVSIHYDPMISKLIAWGETRGDALRTLSAALREYQVVGLPNNIEFLQATLRHPMFARGGVDTSFLAKHLHECIPAPGPAPAPAGAAAAGAAEGKGKAHVTPVSHPQVAAVVAAALSAQAAAAPAAAGSPLSVASGPWSSASPLAMTRPGTAPVVGASDASGTAPATVELHQISTTDGSAVGSATAALRPLAPLTHGTALSSAVTVSTGGAPPKPSVRGAFAVSLGSGAGSTFHVTLLDCQRVSEELARKTAVPGFTAATTGTVVPGTHASYVKAAVSDAAGAGQRVLSGTLVSVTDAAGARELTFYPDSGTDATAAAGALPYALRFVQPAVTWGGGAGAGRNAAVVTPMPGRVVKVMVTPGTAVEEGQALLVLEAMKMEHVIKAPAKGVVSKVHYKEGETVEDGRELVAFEKPAEDKKKK